MPPTDIPKQMDVASKPLLQLKLLTCLHQNDFNTLQSFIATQESENNANAQEVFRLLLHLAVQVASNDLVERIIKDYVNSPEKNPPLKLDLNAQDENGNTALHLAAAQSRSEVITLLLDQPQINECIVNDAGLLPVEMCKDLNIAQMMQIRRSNYLSAVSKELKMAFQENKIDKLEAILHNPRNIDVFNVDYFDPETGDTLLHTAVRERNLALCSWLLQHDCNCCKRNFNGKLPIDLLKERPLTKKLMKDTLDANKHREVDHEIKTLLEKSNKEQGASTMPEGPPTYRGYLKKYTNFAQGYKLRYFVLDADGKLSYYKDQESTKKKCRGLLDLSTCNIHLNSSEKLKFELIGGKNVRARWQLKANHRVEANKWVWALQSAIRYLKDKNMMKKNNNVVPPSLAIPRTNKPAPLSPRRSLGSKPSSPLQQQVPMSGRVASFGRPRRPSNSLSVASSEVELSDNLTQSGKSYVNKMIENRIESSSTPISLHSRNPTVESFQPVKLSDTLTNHTIPSLKNTLLTSVASIDTRNSIESQYDEDDEIDNVIQDNTNSDEEGEGGVGTKADKDEEYLKVEYGPYTEKLNMFQNSISMELKSISELLLSDRIPDQQILDVVKVSLTNVTRSFEEMNQLTADRDKTLVSMLTKQRDINNIWIQSVKDLEKELMEKSERLQSLGKERRILKKTFQKKVLEAKETQDERNQESANSSDIEDVESDTSDTLEEIAKFISATKEEDENSDVDEFFDAEELLSESKMKLGQENESGKQNEPEANLIEIQPLEPEMEKHLPVEENKNIQPMTSPTMDRELEDKTSTKSKKEIVKTEPTHHLIAANDIQKKKELLIVKQGSFLGYEDGTRKRLALDKDERPKISLWGVLKSMVGKDMTRMTLPVTFNEPTSLLQRVTEDLEYSELLDQAATFEDSTLRLLYIAVFTASSYASTIGRVAKPFNPLLGETYEYSRPDKHYRFFTEQVSHHPPISATWTESPKWDFWGESYLDSKFNGRSFQFKHLGLWYIKMRPDLENSKEELYTFKKPDNTVIGILVGNPQVDNHGEVKILNHTNGDYCILNFKARGWRSSGAYEVRGEVYNKQKKKMWVLGGHWNDCIFAKKVTSKSGDVLSLEKTKTVTSFSGKGPTYDGSKFLVWKACARPDAPFNLTQFAITMNAPQPHLLPWLAPTDTRLRPDQRAMEDGRYDEAAEEKHRLEEKQRAVRKRREIENIEYHPRWFTKEVHPVTKLPYWRYTGDYWPLRRDKQLKDCADIF
ncbi:hypothetical protein NCAS_0I01830 [Naumovozyma castellii]|uniref:PH domain-containing protein n=1 Tax=Naumovozyma castellii TaxID=27288 RepID=G0VK17_NAUCA|nr:hypothetical protein NCAS_0I01830 [Naumovozyma castellii CBS 4309]CCC71851.1 hypothetical protein NCAS_0I01830 [Naumovozyma castellii CBS 4309]